MEIAPLTLEMFLSVMNTGVLAVFSFLLIKGDLIPRKIVDKILEEANERSQKIVTELKEGIREEVRIGMIEANDEIKNGKKKN